MSIHIQRIQLFIVVIVIGFGVFIIFQDSNTENSTSINDVEILRTNADTIIRKNHGGDMEGHTPRGFQGMGTGLFVGDNLNPGFPDGDGVQMFLTFDISAILLDTITSVILYSDSAHVQGSPLKDLGKLQVETVAYDTFSSKLWNLESSEHACLLNTLSDGSFECDVTDVTKSALDNGDISLQFRIRFERAGDSDGEQDLVMFYNTGSNTNEPGLFELIFTTADSLKSSNGEQQDISARPLVLNEIHIPVILHVVKNSGSISTERSNDTVRALFQKSQEIWNQAHIVFDVELQETTINDILQKAVAQTKFEQLYAVLPTNDFAFHIFFVRTLNGSNGIALSPSLALVADRTTVNDFRATAHELGHLLGLTHTSPDKNRLLFRGANGVQLISDEINTSRFMAAFLESRNRNNE